LSTNGNGLFKTKGLKIEVRGVKKSYQMGVSRVQALKSVDLDLEPGETVAVVGVSGCGKTTLLNLLGGVDVPDEGGITVGDDNVAKFSERQLENYRLHRVGFVFQFFNLIPSLTAMENLELNMTLAGKGKSERGDRAMALLKMVGMDNHSRKKPDALSGGEQQRVAIAAALANDPVILLGDEPTGNLDTKNAESITELLVSLASDYGKTVFLATHDPRVASKMHRTHTMTDGQLDWTDE
jgi:ABC-type lipoprotein export system ATPase subunit